MKKNKVMKALGVGALALTGLCTFTGCMAKGAEITEDEKTQIMSTVKDGSDFMGNIYTAAQEENEQLKEQNDLLKQQLEELKANNKTQNEILQTQNTILQEKNDLLELGIAELEANNDEQNQILQDKNSILADKNEILENQNKLLEDEIIILQTQNAEKIKENAYQLLKLAATKHSLNYNGVRDNLKVSLTDHRNNYYGSIDLLTLASGREVLLQEQNMGETISGLLIYGDDEFTYDYGYSVGDGGEIIGEDRVISAVGISNDKIYSLLFNGCLFSQENYELDHFISVTINKEGNYVLTAHDRDEEYKSSCIYEAEVSSDARLISEHFQNDINNVTYVYNYGAVSEDYVNSIIQKAEESEPKALLDVSRLYINTPTYNAGGDVGTYIMNFNVKFYYYENGEIKTKTWANYEAFVADGGTCEGFATNSSGRHSCTFKYNGVVSGYVEYRVSEPQT